MAAPPPERADALPRWPELLVRFLDDGLGVPGTKLRFGADALLGLALPVAGDAVSALTSLMLFTLAARRGVPKRVLWAMATNVVLDALFGSVPLLGDLFDFGFKANRKNLTLLQEASGARPERAERASVALLVAVGAVLLLAVTLPIALFFWALSAVVG